MFIWCLLYFYFYYLGVIFFLASCSCADVEGLQSIHSDSGFSLQAAHGLYDIKAYNLASPILPAL